MGKKRKAATNRKLGQAPALTTRDWQRWVRHVLEQHTTQMAVLIQFTALFALRCGEACALTASDLLMDSDPPQVRVRKQKGSGKSPGTIPITPEKVDYVRELSNQGLSWKRKRSNRHGSWTVTDTYMLPEQGPLFPSTKKKRRQKKQPITYHCVWSAVDKLSKSFSKKYPGNAFERIRSHSGRATAITTMMGQGVPLPISMKFARHKPGSLKVHLNYGQLTCMDVYRTIAGTACGAQRAESLLPGTFARGVHPLSGVTLKNLVEWCKDGTISTQDFEKAKDALLLRL